MISPELDRVRRHYHEAKLALQNATRFIDNHENDPAKAKSVAIIRATLPSKIRRLAEVEEEYHRLEAEHSEAISQQQIAVRSFVFRKRTTLLSDAELAAYPEIPEFLRRRA
jgi:hypothetical protein